MLIPRLFWVALGAGAGVIAVNRVQRTLRKATPAGLADRANASAQDAGAQVQGWWATVKSFAAEREAELRAGLGLDSETPGARPAPPTTPPTTRKTI